METFSYKLPRTKLNTYYLGDVHEGNCNSDTDSFKKAVKIIKDDEDAFWFGMGDYIDAITHFDSKRFDPASIDPKYRLKDLKDLPNKQIEYFYDMVRPIKDKCLGLIIGNHEATYAKYNGFDVYNRLLTLMAEGAKDEAARKKELTLGMVAVGCIQFWSSNMGKSYGAVTFSLNHGDGGGGYLPGYKTSKVYELFRYYLTDINVMGHIHQLVSELSKHMDYDHTYNRMVKRRRAFGVSGSFLQTYVDGNANYFEMKGRKEGDIGFLKIGIGIDRTEKWGRNIRIDKPVEIIFG